jgi:hypothetical protein
MHLKTTPSTPPSEAPSVSWRELHTIYLTARRAEIQRVDGPVAASLHDIDHVAPGIARASWRSSTIAASRISSTRSIALVDKPVDDYFMRRYWPSPRRIAPPHHRGGGYTCCLQANVLLLGGLCEAPAS